MVAGNHSQGSQFVRQTLLNPLFYLDLFSHRFTYNLALFATSGVALCWPLCQLSRRDYLNNRIVKMACPPVCFWIVAVETTSALQKL